MPEIQYVTEKDCPVCEEPMSPDQAWWWTDKGAVCSEYCARVLTEGEA